MKNRYPSGAGDHQIDIEGRVIPVTDDGLMEIPHGTRFKINDDGTTTMTLPDSVQQPQPTGRAMTTNAHEELYRVLLDSAELAPLNVLAQEIEVLSTVLARRINDEMGEIDLNEVPYG